MKQAAFMSRKKFDSLKASGQLEPCVLFPILDYNICKRVWDTSPLIASLLASIKETKK
jgi:hypothetical protein